MLAIKNVIRKANPEDLYGCQFLRNTTDPAYKEIQDQYWQLCDMTKDLSNRYQIINTPYDQYPDRWEYYQLFGDQVNEESILHVRHLSIHRLERLIPKFYQFNKRWRVDHGMTHSTFIVQIQLLDQTLGYVPHNLHILGDCTSPYTPLYDIQIYDEYGHVSST